MRFNEQPRVEAKAVVMRPDVEAVIEYVVKLRVRVEGAPQRDVLVHEIEDALCGGYIDALAGDAWLMQTEQRLHELIEDASIAGRGRELRALGAARAEFQRALIELRRELAALRDAFDRARADSRSA